MLYSIPDSKLDLLEKKVNRIKNKGVRVIFEVGKEVKIPLENNSDVYLPGHEVEVEGTYIINGWIFVATLEYTPNGNIIRCVNSELEDKIPERYKDTPPQCEHCNKRINRKDTFLIYNKKKKDWKQVGRTCLQNYTGGLDATVCAQMCSVLNSCEDALNTESQIDYFDYNTSSFLNGEKFKKIAYKYVKTHGYESKVTSHRVIDIYLKRTEGDYCSEKEYKQITDYAKSIDHKIGYLRNAKIAWLKDYIENRDFGLVVSFINTYLKHVQNEIKLNHDIKTKSWVGEVGEKIDINVKNVRVLYTKDNSEYSYNAKPSYVYELLGEDGNIYIYSTGKDLNTISKLRAKIKSHSEYRGVKQNIITRGIVF